MTQIKDQATIVGRVHVRLKDATGPMTVRQIAESLGVQSYAVAYATKSLNVQKIIRRVPYRPIDARSSERYGWEYIRVGDGIRNAIQEVEKLQAAFESQRQELRVKVMDDHTVTIITDKIKVTIELPT